MHKDISNFKSGLLYTISMDYVHKPDQLQEFLVLKRLGSLYSDSQVNYELRTDGKVGRTLLISSGLFRTFLESER